MSFTVMILGNGRTEHLSVATGGAPLPADQGSGNAVGQLSMIDGVQQPLQDAERAQGAHLCSCQATSMVASGQFAGLFISVASCPHLPSAARDPRAAAEARSGLA